MSCVCGLFLGALNPDESQTIFKNPFKNALPRKNMFVREGGFVKVLHEHSAKKGQYAGEDDNMIPYTYAFLVELYIIYVCLYLEKYTFKFINSKYIGCFLLF